MAGRPFLSNQQGGRVVTYRDELGVWYNELVAVVHAETDRALSQGFFEFFGFQVIDSLRFDVGGDEASSPLVTVYAKVFC